MGGNGRKWMRWYIFLLVAGRSVGGHVGVDADAGQRVSMRQLLRVLEQDALEVFLVAGFQQPLAQIHVGHQRGERSARLQRVLGRFLIHPIQAFQLFSHSEGNVKQNENQVDEGK